MITYDEFSKLDLRVAEVINATEVEGVDKLLLLTIDVGSETKQIVAGIKKAYSPEQIRGKKIIVVNNLKPTKIRGILSNGMLLAASDGEPVLLTVDKPVKNGSKIS